MNPNTFVSFDSVITLLGYFYSCTLQILSINPVLGTVLVAGFKYIVRKHTR